MVFFLVIVYIVYIIQLIDQYKEENIFIKGRVSAKKVCLQTSKQLYLSIKRKLKMWRNWKQHSVQNHKPLIPQHITIRLSLTLSIYSMIFLQVWLDSSKHNSSALVTFNLTS